MAAGGPAGTDGATESSFAAPAVGRTPHLSGESLRMADDLDLPTVQCSGAAPTIQATPGGHTPAFSGAAGGVANPTRAWLARTGAEGGNALHRPARRRDHGRGRHRRQAADTLNRGI